jgi:thioesterase domain-containing protein
MNTFVLVHSPLVGPVTWALVAGELRRRGVEAITPVLEQREGADEPYWKQHARAVVDALRAVPPDRAIFLVGHSGAGPLLPAIRREADRPVAAYVFVDAGLPEDGQTRLTERIRRGEGRGPANHGR